MKKIVLAAVFSLVAASGAYGQNRPDINDIFGAGAVLTAGYSGSYYVYYGIDNSRGPGRLNFVGFHVPYVSPYSPAFIDFNAIMVFDGSVAGIGSANATISLNEPDLIKRKAGQLIMKQSNYARLFLSGTTAMGAVLIDNEILDGCRGSIGFKDANGNLVAEQSDKIKWKGACKEDSLVGVGLLDEVQAGRVADIFGGKVGVKGNSLP